MHTATIMIILAIVIIGWIGYELQIAPDEEDAWPDLKQNFEGDVWHLSDSRNDQKAI